MVLGEQQYITCYGDYYRGGDVTFAWKISSMLFTKALSGYMESLNPHGANTATFIWALNYTFIRSDHNKKLQCVVRVVNEMYIQYETADDDRIHICGA